MRLAFRRRKRKPPVVAPRMAKATHPPSPGPNRSASIAEVAPRASVDVANEDICGKTSVVLVAESKEFSTKASLFTIENLIKKSPPVLRRTQEDAPPPAHGDHHQVSSGSQKTLRYSSRQNHQNSIGGQLFAVPRELLYY